MLYLLFCKYLIIVRKWVSAESAFARHSRHERASVLLFSDFCFFIISMLIHYYIPNENLSIILTTSFEINRNFYTVLCFSGKINYIVSKLIKIYLLFRNMASDNRGANLTWGFISISNWIANGKLLIEKNK